MPACSAKLLKAIILLAALGAATLLLIGCPNGSWPTDLPSIPVPTYPGEVLPATSEILAYAEGWIGDFEPALDHVPTDIADEVRVSGYDVVYDPHPLRRLMVDDGVIVSPVSLHLHRYATENGSIYSPMDYDGPPLAEKPKVRWVRYWKQLANVVIPYGTTYEQSHSYTQGTSTTTGESFAVTLGLSASGWGMGLSAELSYTFSREVTISSETSVTKTFSCESQKGKIIQFTVWQLVDGFRACNADGSTFTDPEYDFASDSLGIDSDTSQLYMSAVEFPD